MSEFMSALTINQLHFALAILTLVIAVQGLCLFHCYAVHWKSVRLNRGRTDAPVDPWWLQKQVMIMSGQHTPVLPVVTKGTVLYFALILEEAGELGRALAQSIAEHVRAERGVNTQPDGTLWSTVMLMDSISTTMIGRSKRIREYLESVTDDQLDFVPDRALVKELLDGTNDLTVVNCGFALATGLPGATGYAEVTRSNTSKANPDTGMIDKTPDGKWIKGREYVAPNMDAVLDAQAEDMAFLASAGNYRFDCAQ